MSGRSRARNSGFLHVFGKPILLAVLTASGLVSALFGDGIWDAFSWVGLGIPVLVIVRHIWFEKGRKRSENRV